MVKASRPVHSLAGHLSSVSVLAWARNCSRSVGALHGTSCCPLHHCQNVCWDTVSPLNPSTPADHHPHLHKESNTRSWTDLLASLSGQLLKSRAGLGSPAFHSTGRGCPEPLHTPVSAAPSLAAQVTALRGFTTSNSAWDKFADAQPQVTAARPSEPTSKREAHHNKPAQPVAQGSSQRSPKQQQHGLGATGWTNEAVWNLPNAISMARLLSGPLIAHWIIQDNWPAALCGLTIAGLSDWADGYAARCTGQTSVLGSYLDPLADKALICCVIGALGYKGILPAPVVGIILGRDVLLVVGAFGHRAHSLNWRWPSGAEFFRLSSTGTQGDGNAPAAAMVQPLYISKVNTVLQLALVAGYLSHGWLAWPAPELLTVLTYVTAGTTVLSGAAYVQAYLQGSVFRVKSKT